MAANAITDEYFQRIESLLTIVSCGYPSVRGSHAEKRSRRQLVVLLTRDQQSPPEHLAACVGAHSRDSGLDQREQLGLVSRSSASPGRMPQ